MVTVLRAMKLARIFTGGFLALAMVATASIADAMLIKDFDRMSADDQARYVTTLLAGSVGYLGAQKRDDMARKVIDHFNARGSSGMREFLEDLDDIRIAARATGKPYEVEHVMLMTMRRVGVDVPKGIMMELAKDFKETPRK